MPGTSVIKSPGRRRLASAVIALPVAGLLAAVVVLALPAGQPINGATRSLGPNLIGEHSALGASRVVALNAAIMSMQRARGEHAGLSRTDYEAGAGRD